MGDLDLDELLKAPLFGDSHEAATAQAARIMKEEKLKAQSTSRKNSAFILSSSLTNCISSARTFCNIDS